MKENTRGSKGKKENTLKGLKAKKEKREKIKQSVNNSRLPESEVSLKDVYTEEANQAYIKRMIEEDEREIRLYEKKLGMKKKDSNKGKRFFKDLMRDEDDNDELFDFLDNITKKVHGEKIEDYSGRKAFTKEDLFKDIIEARDAQKGKKREEPGSEDEDAEEDEMEMEEAEDEDEDEDEDEVDNQIEDEGDGFWATGEDGEEIDFDEMEDGEEFEFGEDEEGNFVDGKEILAKANAHKAKEKKNEISNKIEPEKEPIQDIQDEGELMFILNFIII